MIFNLKFLQKYFRFILSFPFFGFIRNSNILIVKIGAEKEDHRQEK